MSIDVPVTFLDLCQRLRRECGVAGTGPSTVVGQVGEMARIVGWIQSAWMDIQETHQDWEFFRGTISFPLDGIKTIWKLADIQTASGVATFAANFSRWERDSFRNYLTATGLASEVFMEHIGYARWRDSYLYGALRTSFTRPIVMSIAPDKALVFGPMGASGYTVLGDFYTAPQKFKEDTNTDTPCSGLVVPAGSGNTIWPIQHNMMIVYRAMMFYGSYENAAEVYNHGEKEFKKIINRINGDRLPEIQGAGALA